MKKSTIIVTGFIAMALVAGAAGIAFAQTNTPADAAAVSEVTSMSSAVTTLQRVETQREAVLSTLRNEVAAISVQANTLAGAPLATAAERSTASQELMSLATKVNEFKSVADSLGQVMNAEMSLLASMRSDLSALLGRFSA
jgi:recombinational DNA repair ATPase RecF